MSPIDPDDPVSPHPTFGARVKALMKTREMKTAALALSLGIEHRRLGHWISGRAEPPLWYVKEIADRLDVTVDELLQVDQHEHEIARCWGTTRRAIEDLLCFEKRRTNKV